MARSPDPNPERTERYKSLIRDQLCQRHGLSRQRVAELLGIKANALNARVNHPDSYRASDADLAIVERLVQFYNQVEVLHKDHLDKLDEYLNSLAK